MALRRQVIRRPGTPMRCVRCLPGWAAVRATHTSAAQGVDVRPFFSVLDGPRIPAPGGAGFAAGNTALQSYFDEMFLGRGDVAATLKRAQAAANAAAQR